ncbi:phenylalanine--tRNA ligase subunit beta [Rhabdaerophilum calidifontis]|uniref:phenylalanine--tRNA ligase subunit beta n=1 Tax=Rhabdaerophilum calidifontis TaxID=2604328 RepID=UPI00123B32CF|nr:phenylalanine--tRNA ligase subunit beta [Rhabdaerophilum calidifontis]
MKFTLSWLKDHLETDASLAEIVEALTRIGLEVEHVEDPGAKLSAFTVCYVVSAEQHPNADRLRVCMVETGLGGEPVQVVCGAPNARKGMKSVFSPPGTYIPGKDITLGKGVIRGVESNGMLCSGRELLVNEDHDGILDLPADAPIGMPYAEWAGLADPVIEINLTPNRPDAAGIHGIARDLAAAGLGKLKDRGIAPVKGSAACTVPVTLAFEGDDRALCPAFALRLVEGVRNGPSPEWMQKRLRAIGLRPINALVDITNYVTFDRGRPLHVFDAAKVKGALTVRRAWPGESLVALDGRTYALDPSMVVIADENGPESLAGIMGGEHSGCDESTTDVLIESALWDPTNIAQTGRRLGIVTDARYRFERGVDPAFTLPGIELATRLVTELCGGTPSQVTLAGAVPERERIIDFPVAEVKRLTGLDLPFSEMKAILSALGFWVSGIAPHVKVAVPSWRPDIEGKADLVEEIVRIHGIDAVPLVPIARVDQVHRRVLTPLQLRVRQARRALAARGLVEAVTWSFIAKGAATLFGGGQPALALANPIAADLSDMRPSLMPGLVLASQRNADRGYPDHALFEVGQVFLGDGEDEQRFAAAGLRRGLASGLGTGRHWSGTAEASIHDAKVDLLAALAAMNVPTGGLQIVNVDLPPFLHPGRSAILRFGPKEVVGWFGELHPRAVEALGAEGRLVAFELVLDVLPQPKRKPTRARARLDLADLQPVSRDFAFLVDETVEAEAILRIARGLDRALIADVSVFDRYAGKGVEPGKVSIGLAVTLQPRDKTLTDAEIDALSARLVAEIAAKTGAVLRA